MNGALHWLGPRGTDGGIDDIPLPVGPGRLLLCGKHVVGPDVIATMRRCGASFIVCLVEAHEVADRYPDYLSWLGAHAGTAALWEPVPDLGAPTIEQAARLVGEIVSRVDSGASVLVHCGAGLGRAGTVACGVLVALGMQVDAAITHVAAHRPMAGPQAGPQRDLVEALAARARTAVSDPDR